ncbi:uncharacterized protein OCT59_010429 [Rhizophagus irregularis]|uniref:uncharacterized protein n=1 Tax=Rhizophagus irregularis TaxID=588596 RepID=UPI003331D491|nr:hypothetical protein OCT59_010429 [Rhizophagus irregularis]
MPVWSWKEIKGWRKFYYKDVVTKKIAKRCFLKWGGVPRFVLQKASRADHQRKLDNAIEKYKIDIFDSVDSVSESEVRDSLSNKLVHIHTNLPISLQYKIVIINTIKTFRSFIITMRDNIKVFDDPLLSNFEYIAHNILNKGGWFDVRSLESTDDDPTDVQLAFTR